jgi:replicative DNA helicase
MLDVVRLSASPAGDDRQLPRNIEAEAAFLGAILIDNRVVEDLPVALHADHFFEPLHGRIFQHTMGLIERNSIATPVTLKPYFDADEAMKAVGGVGYLAQLTGSGAGLIGARDFARQIFDLALLRELAGVGRSKRPKPRCTALREARPKWARSKTSVRPA